MMHKPLLYLEHFSDNDLALLLAAAGVRVRDTAKVTALLREEPEAVDRLLAHPDVFRWLFQNPDELPYLQATPFLTFSVLVHRAAQELENLTFVQEWTAPRKRLPVFAVDGMRRFLAHRDRRFYLADLLASFTRVMSGTVTVRTARGPRRQRFSELDPIGLTSLLRVVRDEERVVIYRRLGDVALFLTGIFPDYAGRRALRPLDLERLAQGARMTGPELLALQQAVEPSDPFGTIRLYEELGQRWYRLAAGAPGPQASGVAASLQDVADQFREGRRVLNFLADRYLHRIRCQWFPEPAA
ncbi:MAG TPA: hypothetical protein VIL95_06295 [Bacillota bacterium]